MKPMLPAFSPTYIVSTLLALATFAGIESRGLAAEPPDPAYTPNSSQIAGSPNQAGRPSVDALLTEMLTRLQRLETNAQQSPASAGAMPNMGTTAMPVPAGANMSGAGKGGDPVLAGQLAKMRHKMQQLEASMAQPAAGMSGGMAMNGKPSMAAGTPPSGSPPQGAEMPMMMDKMMGMMDKMMGGMGGGGMPAAAPMAGSAPGAGGMSMGGAAAPPSGEMAMMPMMMDKMMGMMDKMMGNMGGGAMPGAAPMAGSAPGAGAMSTGGAAATPSGEMAMMVMMMDKMMGMMEKKMGGMGGGAMPPAAPMASSTPGAGAMSMGGAAAPPSGEMSMMPMMMGKMMGMMDKMMGNMGGGAMPGAAPMAGSAPGAGAMSMGSAAAPPSGEMAMMAMMMDKMMGMMDKKMGGMGGGAMPPAAPMAGSALGAGAMSMGGAAAPPSGEMAMMSMMMDKMMGMMEKEMGGMPAPAPMSVAAPSAGMGMMDDDSMEMAGVMGEMGAMGGAGGSAMTTPSALPGFAGASHLYHIGSTGFFLNHPQHIDLTVEQRSGLNKIKERTELDQASASRSEQAAEQDMWQLTSADQPDNALIEAKLAMIQKMKGDARMQFINAVGSAAKLLTDQQRSILTGYSPPAPAAMPPAAAPPMAGAMKDM